MIVEMSKVYVAARSSDRDRMLDALGELGAVHLSPVDPARAVPEGNTVEAISSLNRAMQVLSAVEPSGERPELEPVAAAEETLQIQRRSAEHKNRLAALHRQLHQLQIWGEVRLKQFEALRQAGIELRFFSIPAEDVGEIRAECVEVVGESLGKRLLVAVAGRGEEFEIPESAEPVEPPARDRPAIRAEAAEIDKALKQDAERLARLARLIEPMRKERRQLAAKATYTVAQRSGLAEAGLFAAQGWVPKERVETLSEQLADSGVDAAIEEMPPAEDEQPPTLIRYPKWARPMKGLFDTLGTYPGYKEMDLSPFFMMALPIFAAMIIGDAGYGIIFLAVPILAYRRLLVATGKERTHLLITFGAVTVVWGVLTANYFGVTPRELMSWGRFSSLEEMRKGSGLFATLGSAVYTLGALWHPDEETARYLIIKVSFIIGSIHLIVAHLRRVLEYWPDAKSISEIGWCAVLAGMLGVIWKLFNFALPDYFTMPDALLRAAVIVLLAGYVLAVLFAFPRYGVGKRIGLGFASSLLPIISTFGDTMSYIRLMAVGLASYHIASAFNGLGALVAKASAWLWIAGVPIIVFGHALNIGLAIIAIFAHGVRLNMLEFSNNAGVQWAGYPYEPFSKEHTKES